MQAVGMAVALVLVAGVAGTSGFLTALVWRRRSRRPTTVFTAGFLCGVAAAAVFEVRRRVLRSRTGRPVWMLAGGVAVTVMSTLQRALSAGK